MRAALATKLRCTRPTDTFAAELQRLGYWLPPHLRPLLITFRRWQQAYDQATDPQAHLAIERQALDALTRRLTLLPERALLLEFLGRLRQIHADSATARQQVLAGKAVDADLETKAIRSLLAWLESQRKHPEIRALLARLIRTWWGELHPDGIPPA